MELIPQRILHGLRLVGAGVLGGFVAGSVAGLGARLVMFLVRVINPTHNGMTTHWNAVVGRFTLEGTASLVVNGALFYGATGAIVYLVVRRWMPGRGAVKGLVFGAFMLVFAGRAVIDGSYEYVRYIPPGVARVSGRGLLHPALGLPLLLSCSSVRAPRYGRCGASTCVALAPMLCGGHTGAAERWR
ncbi:MAG: hypothetical protein LC789_09875 [Actinobacteria bacterium]|nr:hypothetical protein [Actinomycetota bacterium]